MESDANIFVAGGTTFLGAPIVRALERNGFSQITSPASGELDLTDAAQVDTFFATNRPDCVFMAAGEIGGIGANQQYPADLMLDNLKVECNIIQSAHQHGVNKLLYLGSSCGYPKLCEQPMRVESLMTGPLEPTSEAYALAKLAGIKLCQAYRQQYGDNFVCGIPANPFGPGDDFDAENAHVIGALMGRMHHAKLTGTPSVTIWGTGAPRREFIFVDDLADACVFLMLNYDGSQPVNLGSNTDMSILQLANSIKEVVGYNGEFEFDTSKTDGAPMKMLDSAPIREMGWRPQTSFEDALDATYGYFLKTVIGESILSK